MLNYTFITRADELSLVAEEIVKADVVGIDIETTSLDPRHGEIRLFQVIVPGSENDGHGRIYVVDLFETRGFGPILQAVQDTKAIFVIHNAKFELKWLWWHHRLRLWPIFCTFRASAIIYNGKKGLKHDLDSVVVRELNEHPANVGQGGSDWSGPLTQAQKDYGAEDVLRLLRLRTSLRAKLVEYGLLTTALIEFGVVLAEARTELNGFPVHGGRWRALAEANETERARLREELLFELPHPTGQMALPGMGAGWNIDSPQQMLASLKRLGLKIENTPEIVLAQQAAKFPLVRKVLEYRGVAQRVKTYGAHFLRHADRDGRIHADYFGLLATGRYSANKSLQQIPRERAFRACFSPREGRLFVLADYCMVPETRVLRSDLRWVALKDLMVGDELVAFDEELGGRSTLLKPSVVEATKSLVRPCYRVTTDRGEVIASDSHAWVGKKRSSRCSRVREWLTTAQLESGDELAFLCDPWVEEDTTDGGYLAGFFDGEASFCRGGSKPGRYNGVSASQKPGIVWDKVRALLDVRGYEYNEYGRDWGIRTLEMGVLDGGLRLVGSVRPVRLLAKSRGLWDGKSTWGKRTRPARVLKVEFLGDREVLAVQTSTRTLIAEGFLTHNSGIEMCLCAEISGDPALTKVFVDGLDAHKATAAVILEIALDQVTKAQRQNAKPVNFGFIYGMMPDKFVLYAMAKYGVIVTPTEAKRYRNRYFERYAGVALWHRKALRDGERCGFSRSIGGRIRYLDPYEAHNEFLNTPVQSSGADALKTSLAIVQDRIDTTFGVSPAETPDGPVQIVHHVHDEIILETDDDPDTVAVSEKLLHDGMKEGMEKFMKRVPTKVDPSHGDSWASAKG